MLLFLLFYELISSISKDSIKRHLNSTIGLCIVYPDNSGFNITKDPFFRALLNKIQGPFTLSTTKYSEYSLSDKTTLSQHFTNIIITRENQFLEHYQGNFSLESVSKEINQVFYSYVEILNESSISDFKKARNSLFLLTGPTIIKEYEDAAFYYKDTNARFGFLYQNSSTDSFVSLIYIKNKHNVTRIYDRTVPLIQFIRSCKSQFSKKNENHNFQQLRIPMHSIQFVAISNNFSEEIQTAFDYINNSNYKGYIDFDVVSIQNSIELKKKCNLKKTDFSNLSFVIYPKFRLNGSIDDCFVFQDMDFYSKELLYFFVSKTVNFYVFHFNNKIHRVDEDYTFSNPLVLSQSNFSRFVPGRKFSIVFIECQKSFSNSRAKMIFNSLSNEFKNKKVQKPVLFCRIEYQYDDFKLPSADSFPTFAIFKPFDKRAVVFNQILTLNNLRDWVLKTIDDDRKEDIQNENIQGQINSPKTESIYKKVASGYKSSSEAKTENKKVLRNSILNKPQRPKIVNIDRKKRIENEIKSEL